MLEARQRGPPRCPPRAGTASPSRPSTNLSQVGTIFPRKQGCKRRHGQQAQQRGNGSGPQATPRGHHSRGWASSWHKNAQPSTFWAARPMKMCLQPPRDARMALQDTQTARPRQRPKQQWHQNRRGSQLQGQSEGQQRGGLQRHSAPVAASDKSYREESNKCIEARGAQDDLSEKEDNEDKEDGLDNKVNTPSLSPLPQRNVLDDNARYYNNVS
jgi:hypothetical protein